MLNEDAIDKYCPFRQPAGQTCSTINCMAWEDTTQHRDGVHPVPQEGFCVLCPRGITVNQSHAGSAKFMLGGNA